jgi:hypothetical protein
MDTQATQEVTIQGIVFAAPAPYDAGHEINEAEAKTLNQVLGENLRNNFAAKVKDLKDKAEGGNLSEEEIDGLRTAFAEYAAKYEFSGKRQARAPLDPVAREASKIAKQTITTALTAKGLKVKDLKEGQMDDLVAQLLSKQPGIMEEARRRVSATQDIAADALEGLV